MGPVTKGGWCPFECLSLGPHGCLEAMAPESRSLHVMLEEESLYLTDESIEVPGGDVTTSGYGTNKTAEQARSSALALVQMLSLSVPVSHPPH